MRSAERPADANDAQLATEDAAAKETAQGAAEEECFRAVVDLREVAQKLDKHQFQEKAKLLDNVDNKAMFVPKQQTSLDVRSRHLGSVLIRVLVW